MYNLFIVEIRFFSIFRAVIFLYLRNQMVIMPLVSKYLRYRMHNMLSRNYIVVK